MKLRLRTFLLILVIVIPHSVWSETKDSAQKNVQILNCEPQIKNNEVAKRGCCSHHQGVCGCSGGRATCCDGTLSPSCGCNSDSIKDELNPVKTRA
jgi:hypothetical protein